MGDDAQSLLKRQSQLEGNRSNFETWWQQIAQRGAPHEAVFTTEVDPGQKRFERMFDGTLATAADRFAAVVEDLVTPRTQKWNTLVPAEGLDEDQESRQALDQLNSLLYQVRYRPRARFAENRHACYKSLGLYGNYGLMVHDLADGTGAYYEFFHPSECYWETDYYGSVNRNHRKYKLGAAAIVKRFGDSTPKAIVDIANEKPFERIELLHVIQPNEERIASRRDYRGWAYSSFYVYMKDKQIIEASGYKTWPLCIGRYSIAPGEVYARSPAMLAWPAILTLNEEKKTVLRAGQAQVHPPLLLSEDGALEPFNMRPGALNHGMLTDEGDPLAVPLKTGADIPLGIELMGLEKQDIEDAFLTTIFKVLVENPQMTATQVLEIAHERGVLLAPTMGRLHSEDLGVLIPREIQILADSGRLPEMPEQLYEAAEQYRIEYQSSLARAMRAQEALAITRMIELLPGAIQLDPNAAYVVDIPESVREVAAIQGVPPKLVRDKRMVAALAEQQAAQDQVREAVAAAPDVSKAALNAAQAENLRAVR